MLNKFKKEEHYLKGFVRPFLTERNFKLTKSIKFKTNGELYEEDLNILKKTNPIQFKLFDKFLERDLKLLINKKNANKLTQFNLLKGKKITFKINNENNNNKRIFTESTNF